MTGLEDFRKEVISLGVSGKVVCLGGQSVYGGFSGASRVCGWLVGPWPALPSTVRLISPNPLV